MKRGETYIWNDRVLIEVLRVARDQSWADIRCTDSGHVWTKRQRLPFPRGLAKVVRPHDPSVL